MTDHTPSASNERLVRIGRPPNTREAMLARAYGLPANEHGCRIWDGSTGRGGYPIVRINRKDIRVTRLVLGEKLGRELAADEFACHTCDTPSCVEASHLWAGTVLDNNRDSVAKGRNAKGDRSSHRLYPERYVGLQQGEKHSSAKLTEKQVLEIRIRAANGERPTRLAAEFGINPSSITGICKGKKWRHLPWIRGEDQ